MTGPRPMTDMPDVIVRHIAKPPTAVVESFGDIGSADVSDVVADHNTLDPGIGAVTETARLCGPAVTVRLRDEQNTMVNVAYDLADPGDVIVIETDGMRRAAWGDTYINRASGTKVAGGVVDGYVRDVDGFDQVGFPVFSRGTTPRGPLNDPNDLVGSVNVPVTVGGVTVRPGDILVGDADGVAVVPQDRAAAVHEAAGDLLADLAAVRERLDDGEEAFLDVRGVSRDRIRANATVIDERVDYGSHPYPDAPAVGPAGAGPTDRHRTT